MLLSFILAVCFTSLLKNKNINIRIGAVFMVFFVMYGALTSTFQYELTQIMLYSIPFLSGIFIGKRYYSQNRNTIFAPLFSLILVLMAFILCFWGADFAACMAIFRFFIVSWLIYTLGIWFFNSKQILTRVFVLILAIALCLSFVMFAEKIFSQKFANGTWTGEVSVPAELSELEFFTDSTLQTKINISDLGKKVYVLDFSNPGCGICFRQMPDFQKLMEKYQDNSEIGFYTIYVYNDTSDIAWFERYTEKRNITIPHLFIDRKDSIYVQVFDYRAFPQYNIIKNNTIIFDGYLNVLKFFHKKYLKN
jgi:thiol-disulfide isomerase/thioredoxin